MSFLSEFSEKVNNLVHTPYWWPLGDKGYSKDQTENEKRARRRAMEGTQSYYSNSYGFFNSFSGADIVAYIHIPPQPISGEQLPGPNSTTDPVVGILGSLQTISYSTFRDVQPVRSIGKTYSMGYTRGPRTIAGTLVWTVLDQYVLAEALKYSYVDDYDPSTILIDQIPAFNIIITCNNEYGDVATMGIYGVRIVNEGTTFSIDDMITEQTNTYVASDIDMLHKGPPFRKQKTLPGLRTSSDVLMDDVKKRMSSHRSSLQ
jgi:hypothetical protein